MLLTDFNAAPRADAAALAQVWAAVPAWADQIADARPFESTEELLSFADAAARAWTEADLDAALAHHPRIGQRPTGSDAHAQASRSEQAAVGGAGGEVMTDIAAANAAYEDRFGRVFLIRAAGRTADEILSEARRRTALDDDAEVAEALDQLRAIALLRIRSDITESASEIRT